ncbi:MAG TPA: hypothetical protein EYP33_08315 [Pyrodictium sp.]|nr:hypothetical protein [Pyrodictium sp.]
MNNDLTRYAGIGVVASIIAGFAPGVVVWSIYGAFLERELVEASFSLIAAVLLTTMIYWMAKDKGQS